MKIREITADDFPKIIWKGLEEWENVIKKDFAEKDSRNLIWLVAEIDREPIGQIIGRMKGKGNNPNLFALRVREDFQRKGIGTELIKKAEEMLIAKGAKVITLEVDVSNEALRLYERLAYKQAGTHTEHWERTYKGKKIEEDIELIDLEKHIET